MILEAYNLKKHFRVGKNAFLRAVDDVSFSVKKGETFCVVGESGSGKSTLARVLVQIYFPTSGRVLFKSKDIFSMSKADLRIFRREVQMVFQDPASSIDPRKKIKAVIEEGLKIQKIGSKKERMKTILDTIRKVKLDEELLDRYPHELSGGQKQRVGIARALALKPSLLILDEPTSSLDVSVQAKILNLLSDLQSEFSLTYLFITHDIDIVRHIATQVMVVYLGKIMEMGPAEKVLLHPLHPYTVSLLESSPHITLEKHVKRKLLKGEIPSPINPPQGCPFKTRCPLASDNCNSPTSLKFVKGRWVTCNMYGNGK